MQTERTQRLFSLSDIFQVGVLVYLFSDFSHRSIHHQKAPSIMVPFLPNPSGDQNHPQGSQFRLLEDQSREKV